MLNNPLDSSCLLILLMQQLLLTILTALETTILSSTTVCIYASQRPQSVTGVTTSFPIYREISITAGYLPLGKSEEPSNILLDQLLYLCIHI